MKKKYGMIPFFIPHVGCPHACIFCNQHRIAVSTTLLPEEEGTLPTQEEIRETIAAYTEGFPKGEKHWEVAFYGGSFTALPMEVMESLLKPATEALESGLVDGIRCSTRPDGLGKSRLDALRVAGVTTVELGVQSMVEDILKRVERGHTAEAVRHGVRVLRQHGFSVGLQMMPGLPGETWRTLVETTVEIAKLEPDFVRIYPVVVMKDTALGEQFLAGEYEALTLEQGIDYAAFCEDYFASKGIPSIRTGLQPTDHLSSSDAILGGPYHPSFGELVKNERVFYQVRRVIPLLKELLGDEDGRIFIRYPRRHTSIVKGLKKKNESRMRVLFGDHIIFEENNDMTYIVVEAGKIKCPIVY